MRKLVSFFAIALFLSIPLAANADTVGTANLTVAYSSPIEGGYYLDYDGTTSSPSVGFNYSITNAEIFCVSNVPLNNAIQPFKFYSITNEDITGIDAVFGADTFNKLARAAFVGNNWESYGATDTNKGEAQKAVWKIMGFNDFVGNDGLDLALYNAAMAWTPTAISNWYYAADTQDFITPVPEPGILILLGIAMSAIGAASWRLRKL